MTRDCSSATQDRHSPYRGEMLLSGVSATLRLFFAETRSMSVIGILQQLCFRDYTAPRMLSRKWRVVVFAMAFLSVLLRPCAAGPIKMQWLLFCRPKRLPSTFTRFAPVPPSPTIFHLDLTHIIPPPEFRTHDPKAPNPTAEILQAPGWDSAPPCRPPAWLPITI